MLGLALSDVHGRLESLEKIVKLIHNREVDLVLLLGDLTNFGGKKQAEEALQLLPEVETLAIAGNLDMAEVAGLLEEKGISLHGKKKRVGGFAFAGFGGGLRGNPGAFLVKEADIKKSLDRLVDPKGKTILLTHLPPLGTRLDLAGIGMHIGSKAVMQVIEEKQPLLHLCGHCHESFGEERFGKTLSINVGAVKDGRALLLHLGDEIKWERIQV